MRALKKTKAIDANIAENKTGFSLVGDRSRKNKEADFYMEVSPPDSLSSLTKGTPISKSENPDGSEDNSSLPDGDSSRDIGRPSPDSPSLKHRDLYKQPKPSNDIDLGYVNNSGSGSARVIPNDKGYANKMSAYRTKIPDVYKEIINEGIRHDFQVMGSPSFNGMKLSILGKSLSDIYRVLELLYAYLNASKISYKFATRKRVESLPYPQKHKLMTIYIPDHIVESEPDGWKVVAEDVSSILHRGRYKGWHNIKTPPLYEHYSNAVFFRNDRDSFGNYIPADRVASAKKKSATRLAMMYIRSTSQPAQDLAGIKTWVDKNRQDQSQKSTQPLKTRPDYGDGSPDRDRVLPLPSGHPEGRDEIRVGPGVMNTPPDSTGQGSAKRPPKDPDSLSQKPLHERPRSSAVPGEQYGNPYIDQSTSTGLKRRSKFIKKMPLRIEQIWDIDDEDNLVKVGVRTVQPPQKRQRKQQGQVKREYLKRRRTMPKTKKNKAKIDAKRRYRKQRSKAIRYQENRRRKPKLYERREVAGIRTKGQKSKRDNKTRKENQ